MFPWPCGCRQASVRDGPAPSRVWVPDGWSSIVFVVLRRRSTSQVRCRGRHRHSVRAVGASSPACVSWLAAIGLRPSCIGVMSRMLARSDTGSPCALSMFEPLNPFGHSPVAVADALGQCCSRCWLWCRCRTLGQPHSPLVSSGSNSVDAFPQPCTAVRRPFVAFVS